MDHWSGSGPNCCNDLKQGLEHEPNGKRWRGIFFPQSEITIGQVIDGTSKTYLAGEKYILPEHYTTGGDSADNETWNTGWNNDNYRVSGVGSQMFPPLRDRPGLDRGNGYYGSAHQTGFFALFCDGHVENIEYGVEPIVHRRNANRKDEGTPF